MQYLSEFVEGSILFFHIMFLQPFDAVGIVHSFERALWSLELLELETKQISFSLNIDVLEFLDEGHMYPSLTFFRPSKNRKVKMQALELLSLQLLLDCR